MQPLKIGVIKNYSSNLAARRGSPFLAALNLSTINTKSSWIPFCDADCSIQLVHLKFLYAINFQYF